jgi:hypothetical protein
MATCTLENGPTINKMESASFTGAMETITRDNGRTIVVMDEECETGKRKETHFSHSSSFLGTLGQKDHIMRESST